MRIGILTGGGDVPGLNPCIKAITVNAVALGWEVVGFRRGWAGPLHFNPSDAASPMVVTLDRDTVRSIDREGGTILHTSRTNPGKVRKKDFPAFLKDRFTPPQGDGAVDCTAHILDVMRSLKIDALVPIGGDDTLSYAARLHDEGFPVIACPKTMDNDVFGTDYCIGFSTAVSRSVDYINALRTPSASHERIAVIEVFGRHSGETALMAGYLANADRVLISEVPFDIEKLADLIMADKRQNPRGYAMVIVSEGAREQGSGRIERGETDAYGHRKLGGIGQTVGDALKEITGQGIVNQSLAYLMRAGAPDALDLMVAQAYGTLAVQLLEAGKKGLMVALRDGNYTSVPIDSCTAGVKRVDVDALYDSEAYRPRIREVLNKPMFLY